MRVRLLSSSLIAAAFFSLILVAPSSHGMHPTKLFDTSPTQKDLVLSYYYPWYNKGDWSRHDYDGSPTLGKYGTNKPGVARQHIEWAKRAGLDAFVISWWGPGDRAATHLREGYLRAPNVRDVKFAFIYESTGRLDAVDGSKDNSVDFRVPAVFDRLRNDVAYLRDHYFKHPSYLRIGGRPLLVIYLTRVFRGFTKQHIAALERLTDVDLFLIADEPFFGEQSNPKTARHGFHGDTQIFDAYTAYNMFENRLVRKGESTLSYMRREVMPIYKKWAETTTFVPGIFPRYKDFRGKKRLGGTPAEYVDMIGDLKSLPLRPVGDGVRNIYLITSFNEWWEGTTIEPAEEYGYQYLDATRHAFKD